MTKSTGPHFDRIVTARVKGLMILFMFIHHFFTFPSWYVEGISYPYLERFAQVFNVPLKICVPVFAFLTGYFYVFSQPHSLRYSFSKMASLLIDYWCVYVPFLILSFVTGCGDPLTLEGVIQEAFGIKTNTMVFCWYVGFYLLAMLLLPCFYKFCRQSRMRMVLFGMLLPYGLGWCIGKYGFSLGSLSGLMNELQIYYPYITIGYICADSHAYEAASNAMRVFKKQSTVGAFDCMLATLCFFGQYYLNVRQLPISGILRYGYLILVLVLNYMSVAVFVYCIIGLLKKDNAKASRYLFSLLEILGKYSTMLWFVHCLFFGNMKSLFQPILYLPRNPIFVLVWGVSICLLIAVPMQFCSNRIKGIVRRRRRTT